MNNPTPKEISKIIGLIDDFSTTKRSPDNKIEWLRQLEVVLEDYITELQIENDILGEQEDE